MIDIQKELEHPETKRWFDCVEKYAALSKYVKALDIGTGSGIGLFAMAKNGMGHITSISIEQTRTAASLMRDHGFSDRITFLNTRSDDFFAYNKEMFELISVDGGHDVDDVYCDAVNGWRSLLHDGYMIFDDYEHEKLGRQVKEGVNKFLSGLAGTSFKPELIHEFGRLIIHKI